LECGDLSPHSKRFEIVKGKLHQSMSLAINRENFVWHKLHSLSGIVPVGFYMLQHLTLNSFTLAGESSFNGVISFFSSIPWYVLLTMEILLIWVPLLFHAIYGLFITNRSENNYFGHYKWSQNRMYMLQRFTGMFLFLFLIFHVGTTTGNKYLNHDDNLIMYAQWQHNLSANFYLLTFVYVLGITAASYHLAYGVWNFCIRWGIAVSDRAQARIQRFSFGMFVAVTLLGWAALAGFFLHTPA
jgi:succinate dehydrogenase / fumarate reductase, cytochrome b subunit